MSLLSRKLSDDAEIASFIQKENQRQRSSICLIASENIVSKGVMDAVGSCLTNKYAEGYPGKRYYEGCQVCDDIESICIERACKLFNAKYANVQPHSGSQANQAVLFACLNPKDTIMGMALPSGGHLTHGFHLNFSGSYYKSVTYAVNEETMLIDYDELVKSVIEHTPKLIFAGYSSYSREIDWERMRNIADLVGAILVADIAHIAGLVAGNALPSPMQHAHIVTTTTHKTLRGPRGGLILTNDADLYKKINRSVMPGIQGGPLLHTIAAKAVCFADAMTDDFKKYAKQMLNNAHAMCGAFQKHGLSIISEGTANHLMVIDVSKIGITGKNAAKKLAANNIVVNYNAIPFETLSLMETSGIRIGVPAITSCGFLEQDCEKLAEHIVHILLSKEDYIDNSPIKHLFDKINQTYDQIEGV